MKPLNQSINELKTQVNKAIKNSQSNTAASNELQLQQEVANMGARVTELEEMKNTVKDLQVSVKGPFCDPQPHPLSIFS